MAPDARTGILVLMVCEGPEGRQTQHLIHEGRTTVGRTSVADIVFPSDNFLSGLHFGIDWDGIRCCVVDLRSSNGIFLNNRRITEAEIADGAILQAGRLVFTFTFQQQTLLSLNDPPALSALSSLESLFAIVDACQDIRLPAMLASSNLASQSLFDGNAETEYWDVAPYLVAFPPGSPLASFLIHTGWNRNWAIYFQSTSSFTELRGHLRRFLMVAQDSGRVVYFRFYDPRVLRVFLGACSYDEAKDFLGPIDKLWAAGPEKGSMLRFDLQRVGLFEHDPRVSDVGHTTLLQMSGIFEPCTNG